MSKRRAYWQYISPDLLRRVWAAVTATPCATIYQISADAGVSVSHTAKALHALRVAGYISFRPGSRRSRAVLVPFITEYTIHPAPNQGEVPDGAALPAER